MCSTVNSEHRVNWERSRRWRVTDRPLRFATELQSFRHLPSECVRWSVWRRFKINERPDALQTQTKNTSDFFANALWVFTAFLTVRKATYHCRRVGLIVGCLSLRIGHDGRNPALASVAPGDWVNGRLDIKNIWVNRATWARCAPIVPRHKQPRQRLNRIHAADAVTTASDRQHQWRGRCEKATKTVVTIFLSYLLFHQLVEKHPSERSTLCSLMQRGRFLDSKWCWIYHHLRRSHFIATFRSDWQ